MNHFREWVERYRGAAPTPIAVYRSPIFGGGDLVPSAFGICSYITMTDLEACQTLEEIANLQGQVDARKKDLNAEFGVKPFDDPARTEWASLLEVEGQAKDRVTEVNARLASLV